jgi:hypothetical protein
LLFFCFSFPSPQKAAFCDGKAALGHIY